MTMAWAQGTTSNLAPTFAPEHIEPRVPRIMCGIISSRISTPPLTTSDRQCALRSHVQWHSVTMKHAISTSVDRVVLIRIEVGRLPEHCTSRMATATRGVSRVCRTASRRRKAGLAGERFCLRLGHGESTRDTGQGIASQETSSLAAHKLRITARSFVCARPFHRVQLDRGLWQDSLRTVDLPRTLIDSEAIDHRNPRRSRAFTCDWLIVEYD
jgi:hypothetical protein